MSGEQMVRQDFETVYETCYDRIYKYAYTLLLNREDAEDVTEDTFIAAYSHYDTFDPGRSSVMTWLTRIAHNRAVNLLRSADHSRRTDMPETYEVASDEDFTEQALSSEMMLKLYARLSPEERGFLNLRYVMELKDSEVASIMNLNEKTVNKRYQRLLKRCRDLFAEND